MNVLMVGDVYGEPGRSAVQRLLPKLRQEHQIDLAVVNVENAAGGFGVTPQIARAFLDQGVDVMTTGNHIFEGRTALCHTCSVATRVRAPVGPSAVFVLRSKSGKQLEAICTRSEWPGRMRAAE